MIFFGVLAGKKSPAFKEISTYRHRPYQGLDVPNLAVVLLINLILIDVGLTSSGFVLCDNILMIRSDNGLFGFGESLYKASHAVLAIMVRY